MKSAFISGVVILSLAGCVSSGTQVTEQQAEQFQKGRSTEADVVAKLGSPNGISRLSDGSHVAVYTHIEAAARAATYIPIVGLMAGGADSKLTTVAFTFGPDGLLKDWTSSAVANGVNTGLLNQN